MPTVLVACVPLSPVRAWAPAQESLAPPRGCGLATGAWCSAAFCCGVRPVTVEGDLGFSVPFWAVLGGAVTPVESCAWAAAHIAPAAAITEIALRRLQHVCKRHLLFGEDTITRER